ncbi:MAG: hypothetical protein RL215_1108, partial [Planctomycetota bacterium]
MPACVMPEVVCTTCCEKPSVMTALGSRMDCRIWIAAERRPISLSAGPKPFVCELRLWQRAQPAPWGCAK